MSATRKGQCVCGAVTVEAALETDAAGAIVFSACHCGMCRRWNGGAPYLGVRAVGEPAIAGEESIGLYRPSPWGERAFCKTCGSNLFWRPQDRSHVSFAVGLFEDQSGFRMDSEIFIDRKPDFYAFAGERTRMTEAETTAAFAGGS